MPDSKLELNPATSDSLYSKFVDVLKENPALYQDFLQVRALSNKAHAIIAKWDDVVDPGFFTDEHNLFTEKIMGRLAQNSESSLLEDYEQFQADGETVRSIWDKHKDVVDMRFWTIEAVPVVYEIATFLDLEAIH